MKTPPVCLSLLAMLSLSSGPVARAEIAPGELVTPKMEITGGHLKFTVQPSVAGRRYRLEYTGSMADDTWQDTGVVQVGDGNDLVIAIPYEAGMPRRFYRLELDGPPAAAPAPAGFEHIPAGSFLMGDPAISFRELPVHRVFVSAFYMAKYEVTKALWDEVRAWALVNGYTDLRAGCVFSSKNYSKGPTHPVHFVSWYDVVKWCNARSQKEGLTPCYTVSGSIYKTGQSAPDCNWNGNGYRLPTEAEWEKAARGGLSARKFPWGDTINHSNANYRALGGGYDTSGYTQSAYHPTYAVNGTPCTSPVGSFAANGYGLYDMMGNVSEWCWDCFGGYYEGMPASDPRGAPPGGLSETYRELRGGSWLEYAYSGFVAYRSYGEGHPGMWHSHMGFRIARGSVP